MTTKFKSKAEQTEWIKISDDVSGSESAAVDAFAALAAFDDTAPKSGGQKAYDKWRDKNNDERSELEYAALDAARAFVEAHDAMTDLFDRGGEIIGGTGTENPFDKARIATGDFRKVANAKDE